VGDLLGTLEEEGLDENTWVFFLTDHGAAFPRAKSTLYAPGTGIALIARPPARYRSGGKEYETLFSGVDLVPTILDLLGIDVPTEVEGRSHADALVDRGTQPSEPVRTSLFTEKTFHDSFDPIRAVRTKDYSYIENYAVRPALDLPLDIEDSLSGKALGTEHLAVRAPRELYDLRADPDEKINLIDRPEVSAIQAELSSQLHTWRAETDDRLPDEALGSAMAVHRMAAYLEKIGVRPNVRSAYSADRGYLESDTENP
jgi:arylsulfatase A-like enzyme